MQKQGCTHRCLTYTHTCKSFRSSTWDGWRTTWGTSTKECDLCPAMVTRPIPRPWPESRPAGTMYSPPQTGWGHTATPPAVCLPWEIMPNACTGFSLINVTPLTQTDKNTSHFQTATRKYTHSLSLSLSHTHTHTHTADHEEVEVGRGDQQISHRTNTSQNYLVQFQFWLSGNENEFAIILAPDLKEDYQSKQNAVLLKSTAVVLALVPSQKAHHSKGVPPPKEEFSKNKNTLPVPRGIEND